MGGALKTLSRMPLKNFASVNRPTLDDLICGRGGANKLFNILVPAIGAPDGE
jgi:hypothetical protein